MAITVNTSASSVTTGEIINGNSLGIEFLGVHSAGAFNAMNDYYDTSYVRWPGGLYVEDPVRYDGTFKSLAFDYAAPFQGTKSNYRYDFKSPDFVNWDKANGYSKEGLGWMFAYAQLDNDGQPIDTLSIMTPTAGYGVNLINSNGTLKGDNAIRSVINQIKVDTTGFLDNVYAHTNAPENLTLEIGSEYYATSLWDHFTNHFEGSTPTSQKVESKSFFGRVWSWLFGDDDEEEESDGLTTAQALENVTSAFGLVYAAQVEAITAYEKEHGVSINTAVQIGKSFGELTNEDVGRGGVNGLFIDAFQNKKFIDSSAIKGVDTLIYHRYAAAHQGVLNEDDRLTNPNSPVMQGLKDWTKAGAGDGNVGLIGGWLAPAAQNDTFDSRLHLSPMLDLYSEFLAVGMDAGTVFATNQAGPGTLGHRDGEGNYRAYMGGQLYQMMVEELPGTKQLDGYKNNVPLTKMGQDEFETMAKSHLIPLGEGKQVNQNVFANEYKVVTYLAAGNLADGGMTQKVSFGDDSFAIVNETHLYATYQDVVDAYKSYTTVKDQNVRMNGVIGTYDTSSHENVSSLSVDFAHDYELVELVSIRDTALSEGSFDLNDVDAQYQKYVTNLELTGTKVANGFGTTGNNEMTGNAADNILSGNAGNDVLSGGDGNDTLRGDDGNDRLLSDAGSDVFVGGSGADVFIFADGFGSDKIRDFDLNTNGEAIDLRGVSSITSFDDLQSNHLTQDRKGAVITTDGGDQIVLSNVDMDDLTAGDFIF